MEKKNTAEVAASTKQYEVPDHECNWLQELREVTSWVKEIGAEWIRGYPVTKRDGLRC